MEKSIACAFLVFMFFLPGNALLAQNSNNVTRFGNGVNVVAMDSSFSMKFTARIQSVYEGNANIDNGAYDDSFQIRRARLKFGGFMYDPQLTYRVELALSNADMAGGAVPESGNVSNIVLDAYVSWNFWRRWSVVFGQKKLPGNRERVISSQLIQFVDRSNLNMNFNIDRGLGLHLLYNSDHFDVIGAITMGEGRNMIVNNIGGYDYTLRVDFLPFGKFANGGDYFQADLEREETPKLALGATYDYNDGASRRGGQLGDFLPSTTDLATLFVDAHFKYHGFSSFAEYAYKHASDGPLIYNEERLITDAFYTGQGLNWQAGYLFRNNVEIAARYTAVTPEAITQRNPNTQYTLGLSKYFVGHSLKLQTDVTLIEEETLDDVLMYRLKFEFSL